MAQQLSDGQIHSLQEAINKLNRDNTVMKERLNRAEGTIHTLRAEIANMKALSGHLLGRGMGSTVK